MFLFLRSRSSGLCWRCCDSDCLTSAVFGVPSTGWSVSPLEVVSTILAVLKVIRHCHSSCVSVIVAMIGIVGDCLLPHCLQQPLKLLPRIRTNPAYRLVPGSGRHLSKLMTEKHHHQEDLVAINLCTINHLYPIRSCVVVVSLRRTVI